MYLDLRCYLNDKVRDEFSDVVREFLLLFAFYIFLFLTFVINRVYVQNTNIK